MQENAFEDFENVIEVQNWAIVSRVGRIKIELFQE